MRTRLLQVENSSKGFTIIEVLITMGILSFGLLALASLLVSIMGYNLSAEHVTVATTLAQDKLEQLKNIGYTGISVGTDTENDIDAEGNSGGVYDRETVVTENDPDTDMKSLTVTVSYEWKGTRNVVLKTIIAK